MTIFKARGYGNRDRLPKKYHPSASAVGTGRLVMLLFPWILYMKNNVLKME